jgi:hypothetical protein
LAQAPSGHWQLTVGGHSVARRPAFASANVFTVGRGGNATISYRTPLGWWAAYILELLLWVAAIRYLVRTRRRRVAV